MNALAAIISRTRTTLLLLFMILLAGSIARVAIPVEGDPEIDVPFFVITTIHEGISPEDAERLLVMPLEIELRQVEGVEEINSFASENAGTVMVEFDADFDLDQALLDTREAVNRAKVEFPTDAEEPIVQEQSTSDFPILQINLIGDVPERMLYNIALDLRDAIEAQDGILSADMIGQREELMEAIIDPKILETYQLSANQIINSIVSNNRLIPAGSLDNGEGRFSVKVPSIIEDPRDVLSIPIKTSGDTVITIGDVAEVRRTFKDRTSYARVDGRNTISLQIVKRSNYNVLDAIANAKKVAEEFRPNLPGKVKLGLLPRPSALCRKPSGGIRRQHHYRSWSGHDHRRRRHGVAKRDHCRLGHSVFVPVFTDFYLSAWLLIQLHGDVRHVVGLGHVD
jgi:multidrug efflux pump